MLTPGMTAPDVSCTVPEIEPVDNCAIDGTASGGHGLPYRRAPGEVVLVGAAVAVVAAAAVAAALAAHFQRREARQVAHLVGGYLIVAS